MKFTVRTPLPSLNEYINAERSNKYAAAKIKKNATNAVLWAIKTQKCKETFEQFSLVINYFCKDKRKDKDNIAFQKKFILDGMQKAGIIANDGWNNVTDWEEHFWIDKNNPRIEVEIT